MAANPHLITFYELQYWKDGTWPDKETVKSVFKFNEQEWQNQVREIISPLSNRGLPSEEILPPPPVKENVAEIFDPMFVLACNAICDTFDKRTLAAKLKGIEMSTAKWKAYLKKPRYREYFEKRWKESFQDVELSAEMSLARNVEAGDLQSVKYYYELTGKYRPNDITIMNLGVIIGRLMEILAARLAPDVLSEIADEMDKVINTASRELTA